MLQKVWMSDTDTLQVRPLNIRLKWVAEYHGPNLFADSAVIVGDLIAETLHDNDRAKKAISDLWACSGIGQTSVDVTCDGHTGDVLLTLAGAASLWALAALNELRGYLLDAGAIRKGDVVRVWVGFHQPDVSRAVLQLALSALMQLIAGRLDRGVFKNRLNRLWQACRKYHPDYQARILMVAARSVDVPFLPFLPDSSYWQFGWGVKARVLMESSSNSDGSLGWQWQRNKATAKALMSSLGLPTPLYTQIRRNESLVLAVEAVGFPCVVKPLDGGGGKGVTANIRSLAEAETAYQLAYRLKRGSVMVEAHVPGDDYRLMVIDGRFVAAIRREPSFVVGDGHQTIASLVAELNVTRSSNMVRSRYLRPIEIDDVLERHLASQTLKSSDILSAGQRVTLRSNANLSTGGLCTDVSAACHAQVRAMAEQLAKTSGLSTVGIDYLTTDISCAPAETGGAFIEMNTTPSMDVCIAAGWSEESIGSMVLGTSVGRIPNDLIVLGAESVAMIGSVLEAVSIADGEAFIVGDRLRIGELTLRPASAEPWAAVKAGLRHHGVDRVRVVCSADTLCELGMPLDRVDSVIVAMSGDEAILPPDWLEVLERHACDGVMSEPEQNILLRLLGEKLWP